VGPRAADPRAGTNSLNGLEPGVRKQEVQTALARVGDKAVRHGSSQSLDDAAAAAGGVKHATTSRQAEGPAIFAFSLC
jgi:hypothetical protein